MAYNLCLKKDLKAQFRLLEYCVIICVFFLFVTNAQNSSNENNTDNVNIQVEKTPNSLKFTVVDTEKYELQNVTCRSNTNAETMGKDLHICLDLDPCSIYRVLLTIKQLDDEKQQVFEITRKEKTEYQEPVVLIDKINTSTESTNISWVTEYRACVLNYQVEAVKSGNIFQYTLANDLNFKLFESLSPCREYTITLKTHNINSTLISTQTSKITTEYEEPGNVTLSIVPHEISQMKVSWGQLTHITCVRYFYLKWFIKDCNATYLNSSNSQNYLNGSSEKVNDTEPLPDEKESQCQWSVNVTKTTLNDYVIGGLQGCENYEFQIYINNNETIKSNQTFISPEQVPSSVSILTSNIGNSNISLTWHPPLHHWKCVAHYFVEIKGPKQRPELKHNSVDTITKDTYTIFEGLDPCGNYNYSIIPVSKNGSHGDAFSDNFETLEGRPTSVQFYRVIAQPLSLIISWKPPAYADLCLKVYRLCGWDDENKMVPQFDKTTSNTSINIDGLKSCMTYTIQIIPTTKSMDGELLHIAQETSSMVAASPDVQISGVYPERIAISARETDVNNKCATIFARIVCLARTPAPITSAEKYVKGQLVIIFNAEIGPLSPFTEYVCNTSFFNIAGWSANKTFVQKTESYFPNKPEQLGVKTQTNSSLSFSWTPPLYPNGIINLYILYFQYVEAGYKVPHICSTYSSDPVTRESSVLELSFTNLKPYTRYSIQVAAKNEFGIGEYTSPNVVTTEPWVSDPITNLKCTPNGPSETDEEYKAYVILSWFSPCKSNGIIEYFLLKFSGVREDHDNLFFKRKFMAEFTNNGIFTFNETNLRPEYSYNVSVFVKTKDVAVLSSAVRNKFESPAGIPFKLEIAEIKNAHVAAYENSNPSKTAIVRFPASILKSESGTILYVALLLSQKIYSELQNKDTFSIVLDELSLTTNKISIPTILLLASAFRYFGQVSVQQMIGKDSNLALARSTVSKFITRTSMCIVLESTLWPKWIKFERRREELLKSKRYFYDKFQLPSIIGCVYGTHIKIKAPSKDSHLFYNRKCYFSLNTMIDCYNVQMKYGAMNTILEWPYTKSWNNIYEDKYSGCITQYQTTPARWNPRSTRSVLNNEIEFVIGTENCLGSLSVYCNGPLMPDTEYNLVIRLFTKSGYNDAAMLEFRTDALIELTIILASVSSCLMLTFIAGFVYLWVTKRIKCYTLFTPINILVKRMEDVENIKYWFTFATSYIYYYQLNWQRESCHGIEDCFGDIIAKNFAVFYRELSKPEKIAREFKELTAVALDLSYSASEMGYNKNRYADIFPYDKNRVILDIDVDGSDYINASFIDGYRRRKEYIATQGPKTESTKDFWRMVLQHNVRVVVMVTQFREGDISKCHEYFPFKSKGINVNVKKKDLFDLYDRTELSITHKTFGLKQKVVHFYFKKWPDHGCPTDPMHLITFIRKVKVEKVPSYSPIVVHCSAGVGRTGTFIALDIIMQRLKNESKINIYETVKKLRFQRMKMVQTLAQYTFLYTCTYELVKHKNTRSILKEDNKTQNKLSFENDPESNSCGTRKDSDVSRSDMSANLSENPNSPERCNTNASGTMSSIKFSGIFKEPVVVDNNHSDESFM